MKISKRVRWLIAAGAGLLFAATVGPFLVPIPPTEGAVAAEDLADPDSRFVHVNGLKVHYKVAGHGRPVFVLLHGFAASIFTWREVMNKLAELGTVIAFDRPAFGLTERPMRWDDRNPYAAESQVDLAFAMLDLLEAEKGILVGNSAGGTIALVAALTRPERVEALVLADPAVYMGGGAPRWIRPLLATPQMRRLGPLITRKLLSRAKTLLALAWHDTGRVSLDTLVEYSKPTRVENWDKSLWEFTLASRPLDLARRLSEVRIPTLVVTGDDDRIVPTRQSVRLAHELPNARLVVIPECGHVPQEECPDDFVFGVTEFVQGLMPTARRPAGHSRASLSPD